MDPPAAIDIEPPSRMAVADPENVISEIPSSDSRRVSTQLSTSGLLSPRFHSNDNERSRPAITNNHKEESRPAGDHNHSSSAFIARRSRGKDEYSSVRRVEDLGFKAAAARSPIDFCEHNDCVLLSSRPKGLIHKKRQLGQYFRFRKPTDPIFNRVLREKIRKAIEFSKPDDVRYLPIDKFESIFNTKSIELLLVENYLTATNEELQDKFDSILDRESGRCRRRILGVLIHMSRFSHIEYFIREDIWDDQLPLALLPSSDTKSIRTRTSENHNLMKDWPTDDIELFLSYQKLFFIPFFDIREDRLCFYDLNSDVTLPWRVFERKTSGGSGTVHKVEIDSSHHNFAPSNPVFALKAIETGDYEAYKEELSALEKTCARMQEEKHLIKLLLTFRHGNNYYLLFEWADGNLEEFWKTFPTEPAKAFPERWAAKQCLGIATAVKRIHGLTTWQKEERLSPRASLTEPERDWGRHGDIKPENILWFREQKEIRNLLVMSDLGLTRYHSRLSKSFVPRKHIDGCSWAYRPPELDIEESISQKYDIWSLGCVFLEFCVWYLQGHEGVVDFSYQRMDEDAFPYEGVKIDKFFNIEQGEDRRKEPRVKEAVEKRLRILEDLGNGTTFAKEMVHLIKNKMLRCAPKDRERIDVVCSDLQEIVDLLSGQDNPEKFPQDPTCSYVDDSTSSSSALGNLSWRGKLRQSTADDPDTSMGDETSTSSLMQARSRRLRQEDGEQSEDRRGAAPSADRQSVSEIPAADATTATTPRETNGQAPQAVVETENERAPREYAAGSHVLSGSPATTKMKKTKKHRISQKLEKWFHKPLIQLDRMWKR